MLIGIKLDSCAMRAFLTEDRFYSVMEISTNHTLPIYRLSRAGLDVSSSKFATKIRNATSQAILLFANVQTIQCQM